MFLADYHLHSICSPDGNQPLVEMAQAAVEAGLGEIALTDHCDLLDGRGQPDRGFDWAPILAQVDAARTAFQGRLPIKLGLELGEAWEDVSYSRRLLEAAPVDFVLGSIHNHASAQGGGDYYFERYSSQQACYRHLDEYFNTMEQLAESDVYDVLAHIIYPLRYMNRRDGNHASLEPYEQQLRRIFHRVIDSGRGIEVNTCRGETVEDWRWVLGLYRDCGGELITLGSDAHVSAHVGKGLPQAAGLLGEFGYHQIACYHRRKPCMVELNREGSGSI